MCLAIPMKIKKIQGERADVVAGRAVRTINIQMLPRCAVGDYVLVHAGFAIQTIDRRQAEETLRILNEVC